MTTRENLIPDDQPYGQRQQTRAALQEAGQPTETTVLPAAPDPAALLGAPSAGDGDIFSELAPTQPLLDMPAPVDPMDSIREIRDRSQNPFVSLVLTRFLGDE